MSTPDFKKCFSANLKRIREQVKRLDQQEMADFLGVKRPAYNRWEMCRGFPSDKSLKKILVTLNVTEREMLNPPSISHPDHQPSGSVLRDAAYALAWGLLWLVVG